MHISSRWRALVLKSGSRIGSECKKCTTATFPRSRQPTAATTTTPMRTRRWSFSSHSHSRSSSHSRSNNNSLLHRTTLGVALTTIITTTQRRRRQRRRQRRRRQPLQWRSRFSIQIIPPRSTTTAITTSPPLLMLAPPPPGIGTWEEQMDMGRRQQTQMGE